MGGFISLLRLTIAAVQTALLLRRAMPTVHSDLAPLAQRFGLLRAPRIARLANFTSPLLAFKTILLPEPALADEYLILAHELAHVKRRDLFWEAIGAVVQTLFWFHPLVWYARREEKLAREQAADALALAVTNAPRADYARVLLTATLRHTPELAVGAFASPSRLRRRLEALAQPALPKNKALGLLALVSFLITPALIPWRAVARQVPPQPTAVPKRTLRDLTFATEGRMQQRNGEPIANARVCLVGQSTPGGWRIEGKRFVEVKPTYALLTETRTAADGTYRIPSRVHQRSESIVAAAAGYSVTERASGGGRITLEPARRWVASLTDETGKPLVGRKVRVVPGSPKIRSLFPSYYAGKTDAQGRFVTGPLGTFSGGSGKEKLFELDEPELAISATIPTVSPDTIVQRLVVTSARRLVVEVVDSSGQPVPHASMMLVPYAPPLNIQRYKADSQGRFEITPLAPGDYMLEVAKYLPTREQRGIPAPTRIVRYSLGAASVSKLRIVLTPGVTVRGRVVSGVTGKPVANFPLWVTRQLQFARDGRLQTFASTSGRGGVTDAQGNYKLHLSANVDCSIELPESGSWYSTHSPVLRGRGASPLSLKVRGKEGQTLIENFTLLKKAL
ncbi:M56 family metallopeptidase [Armatimonas sp.]|uniref:M56 family metallopeptidase n=1 Tax=Armatimonas sp. TaxID=1872638 RepID=UPI00286AEBFA|nr:M56 family metallopeptidase [Armatimonas sp.]